MNGQLILPDDFKSYEWEVECKGWFVAQAVFEGQKFLLNFYDPTRISQDIHDVLESDSLFFEKNLIIVESVNSSNMKKAVSELGSSGKYRCLRGE